MDFDSLKARAQELKEQYIAIRRDIHMHPETRFEEFRTTELVRRELLSYGIELQPLKMKTGAVGILKGRFPGKTIAFRADMDALSMQEETKLPYASETDGKCHACGHDIHTSTLLLCARLLSEQKDSLHGTVKFIFQPAEEGLGGANALIAEGALKDPVPDMIAALHCWPDLPAGTLGWRHGAMMASSDRFYITLRAPGGHAAYPDKTPDPIVAAALLVIQLQTIVSRELSPMEPAVVTVAKLEGGSSGNVIPSSVAIAGTVRTFDRKTKAHIRSSIERQTRCCAESIGCGYECNYVEGMPPTVNDDKALKLFLASVEKVLPVGQIREEPEASMCGEDFSCYLQEVPGVYIRLGTGDERVESHLPLHNPKLLFNEEAIVYGACALAATALNTDEI